MINTLGYFGAILLCIAPFKINYTIGKILAIVGLLLLIPQAYNAVLYNLIFLNLAGVAGYMWSLKTCKNT